jgi:uncharacterized protein (TIGR00251 family)
VGNKNPRSIYTFNHNVLTLLLHIQPDAKQSEFCGLHGERLKIRIKAPPVDGKANDEIIRFLAEQFSIAKSQIQIISGELGREKTVRISALKELPHQLLVLK